MVNTRRFVPDSYLYLQLLYDLHLDSTLGRAPVVQGVFVV